MTKPSTRIKKLPNKDSASNITEVIYRLELLKKMLFEKANKNPDSIKDLFAGGQQQAYSHIYFEIVTILEEQKKSDIGYLNWRILSLTTLFILGILLYLLWKY